MLRFLGVSVVLICLGQGCPGPQPAVNDNPPVCQRQYYNSEFAFGIDPPAGAQGPTDPGRSGVDLALSWQQTTGAQESIEVDVGPTGQTQTLADLAQAEYDAFNNAGQPVVNNQFITLSSGVQAWAYLLSVPDQGVLLLGALAISRDRLFQVRVLYFPPITADQANEIDAIVNSFCVE